MNKIIKLNTHVKYLKRFKKRGIETWRNRNRRETITELEQVENNRLAIRIGKASRDIQEFTHLIETYKGKLYLEYNTETYEKVALHGEAIKKVVTIVKLPRQQLNYQFKNNIL